MTLRENGILLKTVVRSTSILISFFLTRFSTSWSVWQPRELIQHQDSAINIPARNAYSTVSWRQNGCWKLSKINTDWRFRSCKWIEESLISADQPNMYAGESDSYFWGMFQMNHSPIMHFGVYHLVMIKDMHSPIKPPLFSVVHGYRVCQWLSVYCRVRGDKDRPQPLKYIYFIHALLCEICKDYGLKGLSYHGGPVEACDCCKDENMFRYVEFEDGQGIEKTTAACPSCFNDYDTKKFLVGGRQIPACPLPESQGYGVLTKFPMHLCAVWWPKIAANYRACAWKSSLLDCFLVYTVYNKYAQ